MKNRRVLIGITVGLFLIAVSLPGIAQNSATDTSEVFNMSLEDLLNTSVTTVSKTAEKESDAPGIISVVTKDELERFGGTTLKDILERVPGLVSSSAYMTDRNIISVRGDQSKITSGHVLVLINGRPVRETLEGGISSEIFATFPTNIINRIEVIKGPGSVLYGSDAFSGVINIITGKADKTGLSVRGLASYPSALGTSGELSVKAGDFSVVLAGKYYQHPDWKTDYSYSGQSNETITKSISVPDKGPGAYLGINYKNLSFISTYSSLNTQAFMPHQRTTGQAFWGKTFSNLGYEANINDKWQTSLNITYTHADFKVDSTPRMSRNSHELVGEWTNFINLGTKSKLIFGGLFSNISGKEISTVTQRVFSDTSRLAFGLYGQIDYQLIKSMKFIGGVQINKNQNTNMHFVPRIGIIWYPHERLNLKVLYSEAFRAPSINELSLYAVTSVVTTKGDPNLKPEKMGTFDVSLSYLGDQLQMGLNYFRSKASDIISRKNLDASRAVYANVGTINFQGIEFNSKWYFNKGLFLTGSILYQENEDNKGNKNVTPISNVGVKAGISYILKEALTLSIFDIYQGDLNENFRSTINPNPGPYNILNLYSKLNLNKLFDFKMKPEFSIFIQGDNLLGKSIWLPTWGLTQGLSMPYIQGRTIYFGANISF